MWLSMKLRYTLDSVPAFLNLNGGTVDVRATIETVFHMQKVTTVCDIRYLVPGQAIGRLVDFLRPQHVAQASIRHRNDHLHALP